ncbi:MAG: Uma2 family endonuclease [Gemmataceae bacterium]
MSVTLTIATFPSITFPDRATASLASFREWAHNNDLPEKTRTDYYKGEVLIDLSKEQLFTHGAVKTEIAAVLQTLCKQTSLGRYWCNGILVTNEDADLSTNPDGTFVSHATLSAGTVTLTPGADGGFVEMVGTVDMGLEVVSDSSEKKDNHTLPLLEAYFEAGIPEYWIVDARGEEIDFRIYKPGTKRYSLVKKQPGGWSKSVVFDKSFRLARSLDASNNPEFTLEVK